MAISGQAGEGAMSERGQAHVGVSFELQADDAFALGSMHAAALAVFCFAGRGGASLGPFSAPARTLPPRPPGIRPHTGSPLPAAADSAAMKAAWDLW